MKPCYKKRYDARTRECTLCSKAILCHAHTVVKRNPLLKNCYAIAIQQILNENPEITTKELQRHLYSRFRREIDVFYYLNLMKEQGIVAIKIKGRTRLYSLC